MEGKRHYDFKIWVRDTLSRDGWEEAYSESVRPVSTGGLHRYEFLEFRLDFYGKREGITIGIEVDDYGHSGKEYRKDKSRTRDLKSQYGIVVLRLEFFQLKGITERELLEEIYHEIKRHTGKTFTPKIQDSERQKKTQRGNQKITNKIRGSQDL